MSIFACQGMWITTFVVNVRQEAWWNHGTPERKKGRNMWLMKDKALKQLRHSPICQRVLHQLGSMWGSTSVNKTIRPMQIWDVSDSPPFYRTQLNWGEEEDSLTKRHRSVQSTENKEEEGKEEIRDLPIYTIQLCLLPLSSSDEPGKFVNLRNGSTRASNKMLMSIYV